MSILNITPCFPYHNNSITLGGENRNRSPQMKKVTVKIRNRVGELYRVIILFSNFTTEYF